MKLHDFRVGDRLYKVANDPRDHLLAETLSREATWEPWQLKLYAKLIKPKSVCYDIGSNIGTSSLAMAHYATDGHVFAFEPVAGTFAILSENLNRNTASRVRAANIGLSNVNGTATIRVDPALLGNAHQVKGAIDEAAGMESMTLRRLDDWRTESKFPVPDFVKIDVEGFEIEVFEGGEATLFDNASQIVIAEFAIVPQRTAGDGYFPAIPKDLEFFSMLQRRFKNLFLIGRDCRLYPIVSYAQLRILMMRGYPVDDILCCQDVPIEIADLIEPVMTVPEFLVSGLQTDARGQFTILNRSEDGWALRLGSELGAVSGVVAHVSAPTTLIVKFAEISAQHTGCGLTPVLVVSENRYVFAGSSVHVYLNAGANWLLLEVQHWFSAATYFINPNDPREIGFNFRLL